MTIQASELENEFYNPSHGFQIMEPMRNKKDKRPQGTFLKRDRESKGRVREVAVPECLLSCADLRAIDKHDLKERVFHRLWLSGYVDREGKGTQALAAAILDQTCAFEGTVKVSDSELLELIALFKKHWQSSRRL